MAGNIAEYTSPLDTLHPTETGVEATARSANLTNRLYTEEAATKEQLGRQIATGVSGDIKALGDAAVQYQDYQDKSKVSAAATTGLANLEQAFQTTMKGHGSPGDPDYAPPADPNDPTVLQRFQDQYVTPFLDNLKKIPVGENGQKYALAKADEIGQHLSTQFHAENANLAAEGAVLRSQQTTNAAGALVTTTPTYDTTDFALKQVGEGIDIAKGGGAITAEGAMKLEAHKLDQQKQIVHAAILSAIQRSSDPLGTAEAWGQKYSQYIAPGEAIQLGKAAQTQMRMDAAFTRQARIAQKQLDSLQADRFVAQKVASVIKPDGSIDATQKPQLMKDLHTAIFGDPTTGQKPLEGLSSADALKLFNFATSDAIVKTSDPTVKNTLQNEMYANTLTPIEIIKAANDGNLSHADAGVMMGQLKDVMEHPFVDKGFEAAMKGAEATMIIPTNISDFKQEFFTKYRQLDPKDRPNALVFSDPNSLISKIMAAHTPPMAERMQYQLMKNLGMGTDVEGQVKALGEIPKKMSLTVNPHEDKNLFSSGRAKQMGIQGGVGANLVPLMTDPGTGNTVRVNAAAAPHFQGFLQELQASGYKIDSVSGYVDRGKRGGFGYGYSEHAYGNAIDINPGHNPQSGGTDLPKNVAQMAAKYGLIWGGDWSGQSRDPMHFEWSGKSGTTQRAAQ